MDMAWAHRTADLYNERYYEYGRSTGYSWYDNYKWEPERSHAEAGAFVAALDVPVMSSCVDFGCAKGYFVRAMVEQGHNCYGIDISAYARAAADPMVRDRLFSPAAFPHHCEHGFSKDVLEHVPYEDIDAVLEYLASIARLWMLIVPLARDRKYLCADYELETTHIIREDAPWWIERVQRVMEINGAALWIPGIKDKWFPVHPMGNLVLTAYPKE